MSDYNVLNESHFLSVSLKFNQYTSINTTTVETCKFEWTRGFILKYRKFESYEGRHKKYITPKND